MRVSPMRFAFEISFLQNLMDPYDFYVALILDLWIAWTRFREFVAVRKKSWRYFENLCLNNVSRDGLFFKTSWIPLRDKLLILLKG